MAAGLPVVAVMSERSEVARIIREEECGVVVKPGDSWALADAILAFHRDRNDCRLIGRRSERAIKIRYNLRETARKYRELIEEVSG